MPFFHLKKIKGEHERRWLSREKGLLNNPHSVSSIAKTYGWRRETISKDCLSSDLRTRAVHTAHTQTQNMMVVVVVMMKWEKNFKGFAKRLIPEVVEEKFGRT